MPNSIPSYSRSEETVSLFPKAEQDVPGPLPDTLNEGAWKLHAEHVDYAPSSRLRARRPEPVGQKKLRAAATMTAARPDDWSERVVAWVERRCAEQGVPVKVTDPLVLAEIAEILRSARDKTQPEDQVAGLNERSRMSPERWHDGHGFHLD
jgi:hypothetical protein